MPSDGHEMSSEQCYAIDTCDRFVPVVGPAAFDRLAVQQEWAYARRKCTAITAVWRLGDGMPEDFGRYRYFDFREDQPGYDYTATLAALADKLRQVAQPGEIRGDWREPPDTAIPRKELAQLAGLLRDVPAMSVTGRAAVGAVHAPGGLGKTVLAGLFSPLTRRDRTATAPRTPARGHGAGRGRQLSHPGRRARPAGGTAGPEVGVDRPR